MRIDGRFVAVIAASAALCGVSARAGAAETETDPTATAPRSSGLTQEWIGLELTPISVSLPDPPATRPGHVDTLQAGPGGSVRLFRHRWEYGYVTPVQAGLYVSSSGSRTIFTHLQAEGGVIVPGTDRRLELGMGTGVGILAMAYSSGCDGTCNLGGGGWLVSFVARYLFVANPTWTAGASARLVVPLGEPDGEWFGYYVGGGNMILGGVEFGFGRDS